MSKNKPQPEYLSKKQDQEPNLDAFFSGINDLRQSATLKKEDAPSNMGRGFKKAMLQIPQTIGGSIGLLGDIAGADGAREYGMGIYDANSQKINALTRPSDSLSSVMEGDGNISDWLGSGAGYVGGQALTAIATGGIGGFVGKQIARRGMEKVIERGAESQMARMVAEQALAKGVQRGVITGAYGSNLVQEAGSIYPEAVSEAQKNGRSLDSADKARIVASALGAAGIDTAMEALTVNKALGGGRRILKDADGNITNESILRAMRREVPVGMAREGATEGVQTGIERYGAGQDLGSKEAIRGYVDSAGLGVLGGAAGGSAGSITVQKLPESGALSRAANAGIDAQNMAAQATVAQAQPIVQSPTVAPQNIDGAPAVLDPSVLQNSPEVMAQPEPIQSSPPASLDDQLKEELTRQALTQRKLNPSQPRAIKFRDAIHDAVSGIPPSQDSPGYREGYAWAINELGGQSPTIEPITEPVAQAPLPIDVPAIIEQPQVDIPATDAAPINQAPEYDLAGQIADTDARVQSARERDLVANRMSVLDGILAMPEAVDMNPQSLARKYQAELRRQKINDPRLTEDETAKIARFDQAKAAVLAPQIEPSTPNELVNAVPERQTATAGSSATNLKAVDNAIANEMTLRKGGKNNVLQKERGGKSFIMNAAQKQYYEQRTAAQIPQQNQASTPAVENQTLPAESQSDAGDSIRQELLKKLTDGTGVNDLGVLYVKDGVTTKVMHDGKEIASFKGARLKVNLTKALESATPAKPLSDVSATVDADGEVSKGSVSNEDAPKTEDLPQEKPAPAMASKDVDDTNVGDIQETTDNEQQAAPGAPSAAAGGSQPESVADDTKPSPEEAEAESKPAEGEPKATEETDAQQPLFKSGERRSIFGMSADELKKSVKALSKTWKNAPKINTVQSVDELPFPAPMDARGAYWRGQAYLVADNLHSDSDAQLVLFHEVLGHAGLRGAFGEELAPALRSIGIRNRKIAQTASKWRSANEDIRGNRTDDQWRTISIEEVLADLAGTDVSITGFDRLVAALQKALRSIGLDAAANWVEDATDAEVLSLLASARSHIEKGDKASVFGNAQAQALSRTMFENEPIPEQVLKEISDIGDAFKYKKSDKKTVEGIVEDVAPELKVRKLTNIPGETRYEFTLPDGTTARMMVRPFNKYGKSIYGYELNAENEMSDQVDERPGRFPEEAHGKGDVWIDVSLLSEGSGRGSLIYHIAANYAHNSDQVFIGDPAGISHTAMLRRPENMLSTALKFGTTEHIAPHPRQIKGASGVAPIDWVYGDHVGNIRKLIDATLQNIENAGGNGEINYDKLTGEFVDADGNRITRQDFELLAKAGLARTAAAGGRTLARYAFLRALLPTLTTGSTGRESVGVLVRLNKQLRDYVSVMGDIQHGDEGSSAGTEKGSVSGKARRIESVFYSRSSDSASRSEAATHGSSRNREVANNTKNGIDDAQADSSGERDTGRVAQVTLEDGRRGRGVENDAVNYPAYSRSGRGTVAEAHDLLRSASTLSEATSITKSILDSNSKFNVWDRTIGTQFGKAKKDADFKKVFDASQQQIDDVAHFAIEAERMAPSVMRRMDSIKENFKAALSSGSAHQSDVAQVSKALFANIEGRQGVQQKVFSVDELRDQFKLNDKQIEMYREARKAVDTSLERLSQSIIASMGQSKGLDISKLKNADMNETAAAVKAHVGDGDVATKVDELVEFTRELQQRGYMPAMRFGEHTVLVQDPATGEVQYFGMHESAMAANLDYLKAKKDFAGMDVEKRRMNSDAFKLFKGVSPETVELFARFTDNDQSQAFQDYIALAKAGRSSMKRLLERKGIAGFSKDLDRVMASFITSNARQSSLNHNAHLVTQALSSESLAKKGDVQKEAQRLVDYLQNPMEEAQKLRGFLFMHMIGGSIASAAVNLTQPILQTTPFLSQYAGAKTAGIMATAAKAAATGRVNNNPDLANALRRAKDDGITEPHEIHNLMADASGSTLGTSVRARALTKLWGSFFSASEAFNRRLTFMAAYQTAQGMSAVELKKAGFDNAYDFSKNAIIETQGLYSKANRPNWARGAVGATLFTFKQFSISYIEFLNRLPNKQKALALGILVAAAGIQGLPFADDIEDLIDTIGQSLGYNTNSKKALRKLATDMLGDTMGEIMFHGLSTQSGLDLHGRLGMSNLLPGTSMLKPSETDKTNTIAEFAGAFGGIVKTFRDSVEALQDGKILGAIAAASPGAIKNALQGGDMLVSGQYRDKKGRNVEEVSTVDAALKSIGFQPQHIADGSRKRQDERQDDAMVKKVQGDIADDWAHAIFNKDQDGVEAARKAMQDWNLKNPEVPIKMNMAAIRQRVIKMRQSADERMIKSASKSLRSSMLEELK